MDVDFKDLMPAREIDLESLRNRIIAVDGYNALYQFLTTIRQPDGTPLMDSKGNITSHLSGLLYRTASLIESGIRPIYVFDGIPPELKALEVMRRRSIREEALRKYEEALEKGDMERARMYAQQASKLTEPMVEEAKRLLNFMGIPWIQAPSEGEAQAAYLTIKGDAWAVASQDYDSLLYGAVRLVRNLAISGRRKLPRKEAYVEVRPEIIELAEALRGLGITREQLVEIAILVGTDYNPEGVKGIGPKRALRLIKQYGSFKNVLSVLKEAYFPVDPEEIKKLFIDPKVTNDYGIKWGIPDREGIVEFLCSEHDFSEERVLKAVDRAIRAMKEVEVQPSLEAWL